MQNHRNFKTIHPDLNQKKNVYYFPLVLTMGTSMRHIFFICLLGMKPFGIKFCFIYTEKKNSSVFLTELNPRKNRSLRVLKGMEMGRYHLVRYENGKVTT